MLQQEGIQARTSTFPSAGGRGSEHVDIGRGGNSAHAPVPLTLRVCAKTQLDHFFSSHHQFYELLGKNQRSYSTSFRKGSFCQCLYMHPY